MASHSYEEVNNESARRDNAECRPLVGAGSTNQVLVGRSRRRRFTPVDMSSSSSQDPTKNPKAIAGLGVLFGSFT
jgi:hypothetical protein